jgi:hypothetical protein
VRAAHDALREEEVGDVERDHACLDEDLGC